jgi:membrane-bound ClpP family serine protease
MLEIYIACLVLGFVLLGAEIYVPGGVLGILGGIALLAAIILGFKVEHFGAQGGMISAFIILATVIAGLYFWLKFFPDTPMGRKLSLSASTADYRADDDDNRNLTGSEGVALNNLRPSGIAEIDGRRVDVVADGSWIGKGTRVKVIDVGGNRVVVRELEQKESGQNS